MDKKQMDVMMIQAAGAKAKAAMTLGIKATWRMEDHIAAATQVMCEVVKDGVEPAEVRAAIEATYNHSAFAQRLEKKFKDVGHFQRSAKVGKEGSTEDLMANIAKEIAEQERKAKEAADAPEAAGAA